MIAKQTKYMEIKYQVQVTVDDIINGRCGLTSHCMEKVSNARALMNQYGAKSDAELRIKVDAGHIRFNLNGHRWEANTPKVAKKALIDYDKALRKRGAQVDPEKINEFPVKAHSYVVKARAIRKIQKVSRSTQERVNENRRRRIREGREKTPVKRYTLRQRVIGFA